VTRTGHVILSIVVKTFLFKNLPVQYASASISCRHVSVCLSVCMSHAGIAWKRLHSFPRPILACVSGKLGFSKNKGTFLWNFVPNSGLKKYRRGTPTVGECDINSDSGRSGVDRTWRRRDRRGECGLQRTTDRRLFITLDV